jgi:hypothetical protein
LDLPPQPQARIGQQIVWSNDLLAELVGDGFMHGPHAGEFLWWAQRQAQNKPQLPEQDEWGPEPNADNGDSGNLSRSGVR